MAIRSETELYGPVKAYWEKLGYDVRGEVRHCDLVAVLEGEPPVVVELKRSLTVPLLLQGLRRQDVTHRVYIAIELPAKGRVPHRMTWADIRKLCGRLGLGLITVQFYKTRKPAVEVVCEPPGFGDTAPARKTRKRAAERVLGEFRERSADYNVGGSRGLKLVTAYREKALHCALLIREQGPLSPRRLRELTGNAKTPALLQRNVYGWFVRVRRGLYGLTRPGEEALDTFAHVAARFMPREPDASPDAGLTESGEHSRPEAGAADERGGAAGAGPTTRVRLPEPPETVHPRPEAGVAAMAELPGASEPADVRDAQDVSEPADSPDLRNASSQRDITAQTDKRDKPDASGLQQTPSTRKRKSAKAKKGGST
ncbi:hypothetical protein PC41400_07440 [Paenibacillus chitinolyticus]|uniref:DUF2161 family putative PD-(D/E)XK-type phosphodiesterase n=1 Tax=Paenibacillus chitinolyticus TaxID=79263 RepID=A0A410WSN5_9BACL|nr:DUF2161 family putative PD-(D/E)XK-type phosphodiesterase [Paenibacillus chitinolyticus]MCY9588745.1 DUF2161 family putative PD-(D/E)XK-type phosphodiesterase [Paenibacillus chitinolyticus]MCY9595751.1 DUF2161 family putative PD-(D/E)XK-type phosphodiesterase [Paenibacillus chitinolyticus]QAV17506.1 hypothetical protein PC41400_07440 [Paenibacillus chitinolyticus]